MSGVAFNPSDPAFLADPMPVYQRLRDTSPVAHLPVAGGVWLVSRYEDIKQVVRQPSGLMTQLRSANAGAGSEEGNSAPSSDWAACTLRRTSSTARRSAGL